MEVSSRKIKMTESSKRERIVVFHYFHHGTTNAFLFVRNVTMTFLAPNMPSVPRYANL